MKKKLIVALLLLSSTASFAQKKEDVIMKVGDKEISKSEFLQIYLKNNPDPKFDQATLDEYVELFRKFKLKVIEAEAKGYDTIPKLKNELAGYRKTSGSAYLVDKNKNTELINEAYQRMQTEIKASHILIRVSENATPADTLKAYNRILALKKRIENGENFEDVASGFGGSEDPSVTQNRGDLGYFTAFQMVYPFEQAAYSTPVGKISNPVRSRFGYHILKIYDQRPSRGSMQAAHIMIAFPKDASQEDKETAKRKADEIYALIKAGTSFEEMAEAHSDDVNSNAKGGVLPGFGSGSSTRMVTEFEDAAFELANDGDISEPVLSPFGYHIIKRISKVSLKPLNEMQKDLEHRVQRDERAKQTQQSFIAQLKKDYKFKDYGKKNLAWFDKNIDESYAQNKWNYAGLKTNKVLFKLDNKEFKQQDYAEYLKKNARHLAGVEANFVGRSQYKKWQDAQILAYEESKLDQKYPEFKALMQEYHDGILLYEIMTDQVWNKASKDTLGLETFFEAHQNKYMWSERVDAIVYECYDVNIANQIYRMIQKDTVTSKHVIEVINKDSELNLKVKTNKYELKANPYLDQNLKLGVNPPYMYDNKYYVVKVAEIIPSGPKKLSEARGMVTSDYQNFLDKTWIQQLENKYPITINKDVLYALPK